MAAEIVIRTLGEADAHALRVLRLRALVDAPGAFASTYETEVTEPESATAERLEQNDRGRSFSARSWQKHSSECSPYVDAGFVAIATLKEALKLGNRYVDEDLMVLRL